MAKGPGFLKTFAATASQGIPNILQGIQGRRDRERQAQWRNEDISRSEANRDEDQYIAKMRYEAEQNYRNAELKHRAAREKLQDDRFNYQSALSIGDVEGLKKFGTALRMSQDQLQVAEAHMRAAQQEIVAQRERAAKSFSMQKEGYDYAKGRRPFNEKVAEGTYQNQQDAATRAQEGYDYGVTRRPVAERIQDASARRAEAGRFGGYSEVMEVQAMQNQLMEQEAKLAEIESNPGPDTAAEALSLESSIAYLRDSINAAIQSSKGYAPQTPRPQASGNKPSDYGAALGGRQQTTEVVPVQPRSSWKTPNPAGSQYDEFGVTQSIDPQSLGSPGKNLIQQGIESLTRPIDYSGSVLLGGRTPYTNRGTP